ncbi:MAG: D-alanyl-D-alanine carboxypeptidase [Lachnospiraceae bacterium]|nr:D-alanyl-D-alanine carboxypeptidase [Lachnospiraceae bacterium]
MKTIWKKMTAVLAAAIFVITLVPATASAEEVPWPSGPEASAESAIVMEANTGTVLYEKDADTQRYPASITKILTTLLALENSSLDEVVTFSEDAVYKNEGDSSHIARDIGEEMTMEQCLYAVMLESANECAYAVAEHVGGGDYQTFIDMMNEKAAELGCTNTNFTNANGLPDEDHVTTCRDMALIAQAAIQNNTFRQIIGTTSYTIPPTNKHDEETPLNNHHRMISSYKGTQYLYEYCLGGKTGYTVAAGNTLVTYAEKDGMLLICVVMKTTSHYDDTISLFDYCFENYSMYNVSESETRYEDSSSGSSTLFGESEAFAVLDSEAEIILPVGADFSDTEVEVSYDNVSDSVLGTLVYSYGGKQVGTADVVATGASGVLYEFGEAAASADSVTESDSSGESKEELSASAEGETVTDGTSSGGIGAVLSGLKDKLPGNYLIVKIIVIAAAVVAALFLIREIRYRIRRSRRRKQSRDRRYKVIKNNRKWNRRGGR